MNEVPLWSVPLALFDRLVNRYSDIIRVSDRQRGLDITMWTKTFWKAAAERAVKTFAQAAGAVLAAGGTGLLEVDFVSVVSVAGLATLLSVLTSVASSGVGEPGTPSLVAGGE
jgi:hypothetical protein